MINFYDNIPDMECLQGDTLPKFTIGVAADSLIGCRMQAIISPINDPANAVICKECSPLPDGDGFDVVITSDDTAELNEGTYIIHFRLIGADGLSRRKLCGNIRIRAAAQGGD